jgi:PIN domain nuclease of toxin-antitoxin system
VLDTHALYWYWTRSARIGPGALAALQALERGEGMGLVPLLTVAELHYLTRKAGAPWSIDWILGLIDRSPSLRLEPLTRRQLLAFAELGSIPEMHDRFIAATGLLHDALVISRDADIRASDRVRSVW